MISNLPKRFFLFIIILLLASLACNAVIDLDEEEPEQTQPVEIAPEQAPEQIQPVEIAPEDPAPGSTAPTEVQVEDQALDPQLPESPVCPAVNERILESATKFNEEDIENESAEETEPEYLVTYTVSGDLISNPAYENVSADLIKYQEDEASHRKIWEYFTTLIPSKERRLLIEYSIVTDGEGNMLAAVGQSQYDPALWVLEMDIRDSSDIDNLIYTLIHEYAHLLTLGPQQVDPSAAIFDNPDDEDIYFDEAEACQYYFPGEGCSNPDSYINAFFNKFWVDIHDEWQDINLIEDDDDFYTALDEFYFKYEARFVTDYAATTLEEDMAEAFTFFVLASRQAGDSIAEEKILFFYDYPELVELRNQIGAGICNLTQ